MDKEIIKDSIVILVLLLIVALILSTFTPSPDQIANCTKQQCYGWTVKSFSTGIYEQKQYCHCVEFGNGNNQSTYERPLWITMNQQ